jgi:hypothetical protein
MQKQREPFEKQLVSTFAISESSGVVRVQNDFVKEEEFQALLGKFSALDALNVLTDFKSLKRLKNLWIIPFILYSYSNTKDEVLKIFFHILIWIFGIIILIIYIFLPILLLNSNYNFAKKSISLILYNDMRSVGILCHSARFLRKRQEQDKVFDALRILLENMEKGDASYFYESHKASLRSLLNHKRIRREFPELMQAIIVALYRLHTDENKLALEKLAKEKPRREEEQWIPKAAQSCLDAWDNNNSIWS